MTLFGNQMHKYSIDFSLFVAGKARGIVNGHVKFSSQPRVGEKVNLSVLRCDILKVEAVVHSPMQQSVTLMLSDLTLDSDEELAIVAPGLRRDFGLIFESFDPDDPLDQSLITDSA
jgi:hypothetical protein